MKSSRNRLAKFIGTVAIVSAMICTTGLFAQGPGGGPPQGADDTQDVPLDGGLIALVIGAAAFGVKKLRDNFKQ